MSDMTKAELEAKLRQAQDKICYCECKNKELQERLSAIVAPVQCDTYAEAVRAYGKQSQLVMAMEEMSELTKELSKNLRGADNFKALAEEMGGSVSSATIRNELADLVEMGYLEQPHTSAGRVPSPKGYRLYVNELMEHRALSREEEDKLNASLAEKLAGTDQLMARAGQMVSSFVGYPAYTVADHKTAATVRRFELIPVDANSFIAVVMLSDSQVKSQLLPLQLPVADGGLPDMSHLLNTHFTGIGPEDMNGRLMSLSE